LLVAITWPIPFIILWLQKTMNIVGITYCIFTILYKRLLQQISLLPQRVAGVITSYITEENSIMATLKPIQLNIEQPCTQGWDEMIPNGVGRHCVHCSKTVIDFTTRSDADLIKYFSKPTGNVCGRLSSQQLNRELHLPPIPHNRLFKTAVALGCTLLLTAPP
jgi:hypothetical protein